MTKYNGGAHAAQLVTPDGSGNATNEAWIVNVNPSGAISAPEAIDTLEAIEATGDVAPIAPSVELIDPAEIEAGNDPSLVQTGTELKSTGTGATTEMTTSPGDGVIIKSAEGDILIDPVGSGSGTSEVTADVAAVAGGKPNDTIVRPIYAR